MEFFGGFLDGLIGWVRLVLFVDVIRGNSGWYAFGFLWGAQTYVVVGQALGRLIVLGLVSWRERRRRNKWREG